MKVDFSSGINRYRQNAATSKTHGAEAAATGKTDVDAIARGSSSAPEKTMTGFKAALIGEIAAQAGTERIAELTAQVKGGTYHVDSEKIAGAMLDLDV